ncbi:hypothetical protein [Natrinema sp. DC36]|uniref:hypothetical protein n=1 Tax=Natrinema sp. DC36 TaxID=2878680 RepID=UPI001CEFE624|nr:hypothetical protein [Natrinema sp. DC36]
MDFEIEVSDETEPDYSVADNFAENLVDAIRSDMVGNEGQFLALNAAYASGLSRNPDEYLQIIVRGKSGEGKTELKQNVDKGYPNHWLLRTGSTSDMGLVDSGGMWDGVYIGAFAEFQQMQGKMLEMVKSSAGDDADERGVGFSHTRNVDEGEDGRGADEIEKQAMPTVFLFADENNAEIPRELRTRQMTVRVEADKDINRAVAKMMFDYQKVEAGEREFEYNFNFEEGKNAIQNHIASIPRPLDPLWEDDPKTYSYPVAIPYDEDIEWPVNDHPTIDSYGWAAFKVLDPILNYNKTDSKRGAKAIANHIRAHARLNYHNRELMEINGVDHIVAEPQDIGNVISYRDLLLNLTHGMDEKKFAVIEALTDPHNGVGGTGPNGGVQATLKDIAKYIDEHADITAISKSQLHNATTNNGVLNQMEEDYLIEIHKGDGPNGAHMFEFLGGSTFGHPNIGQYAELFEHVTDPIRDQPISDTISMFKKELATETTEDLLDSNNSMIQSDDGDDESETDESNEDGLSAFGGGVSAGSRASDSTDPQGRGPDGGDGDDVEFSEAEHAVADALRETLDDCRVEPQYLDEDADGGLATSHMLGASPVEKYTDDRGLPYVRAERPYQSGDKDDSPLDPDSPLWGDISSGQAQSNVENAIKKLRSEEVFESHDEPEGEGMYLVVHDIE